MFQSLSAGETGNIGASTMLVIKTAASRLATLSWLVAFLFFAYPATAQIPLAGVASDDTAASEPVPSLQEILDAIPGPLTIEQVDAILAVLDDTQARSALRESVLRQLEAAQSAATQETLLEQQKRRVADIRQAFSELPALVHAALYQPHADGTPGDPVRMFLIIAGHVLLGVIAMLLTRRALGKTCNSLKRQAGGGLGQTMARCAGVIMLDLMEIAAFCLAIVAFYLVLSPSDPQAPLFLQALLLASAGIILAAKVSKAVLAPDSPSMRLLPLSDAAALRVHRIVVLVFGSMLTLNFLVSLLAILGLPRDAQVATGMLLGIVFCGILIALVWANRAPVAAALTRTFGGGAQAAQIAGLWPIAGTAYVVGLWLVASDAEIRGNENVTPQAMASLAIVILVPVLGHFADRLLQRFFQVDVPQPAMAAEVPMPTESPAQAEAPMLAETAPATAEAPAPVDTPAPAEAAAPAETPMPAAVGGEGEPCASHRGRITAGQLGCSDARRLDHFGNHRGQHDGADLGFRSDRGGRSWRDHHACTVRKLVHRVGQLPSAGSCFAPPSIAKLVEANRLDATSETKRLATLLPLLRKFILVVLLVMIALIVLSSLGIEIGPLLAGAGVVGLAIGLGAQSLVTDIVAGIFFLIDDAFSVGDYIEVGELRGTVESISIRSLKLRHHRGAVHTLPFGQMQSLTNYSRDWVMMKLEFRVPHDTNIGLVKKIVKTISAEMSQHPDYGGDFLEPLKSQGVRRIEDNALILGIKFKAKPGTQFTIRKDAYQKIRDAFEENGIEFANRGVTVRVESEPGAGPAASSAIAGAAAEAIAEAVQNEAEPSPAQ